MIRTLIYRGLYHCRSNQEIFSESCIKWVFIISHRQKFDLTTSIILKRKATHTHIYKPKKSPKFTPIKWRIYKNSTNDKADSYLRPITRLLYQVRPIRGQDFNRARCYVCVYGQWLISGCKRWVSYCITMGRE